MFHEEKPEFKFDWSHLGDIEEGRPNLGPHSSVAVYRLMLYMLRDAIIEHTSPALAKQITHDAGYNAGRAIYENLIHKTDDFPDFVSKLQKTLRKLNIGILRIEESDFDALVFTLTIGEDLHCSGLPVMDDVVCAYNEGFLTGLFETYTKQKFRVREIDCWCMGARVCRFRAECVEPQGIGAPGIVVRAYERE